MLRLTVLLLPFILYVAFLMAMKRDIKERTHWQYKQLLLLTIAGVILVFLSVFMFENKGHLGFEYRPATHVEGVFKPAEWIKRP